MTDRLSVEDFWNLCEKTKEVRKMSPCPILVTSPKGGTVLIQYNPTYRSGRSTMQLKAIREIREAIIEHLAGVEFNILCVTEITSVMTFEVKESFITLNSRDFQDIAMDIQNIRDELWKFEELPLGEVVLKAGELGRNLERISDRVSKLIKKSVLKQNVKFTRASELKGGLPELNKTGLKRGGA